MMKVNHGLLPWKRQVAQSGERVLENAFYVKPRGELSKIDKGGRKNNYFGSHLFPDKDADARKPQLDMRRGLA